MRDKIDLTKFGRQLREFRKQARLTPKELANELDKIAATGPKEAYRQVDASLIRKWESAYQQRRPTRFYVIYLIQVFRPQFDLVSALEWAEQAGYKLTQEDLETVFPIGLFHPPPQPQLHFTLGRLDPLPPHRLFGTTAVQSKLEQALQQTDDHWILSLWGIGGIGKTALANLLVRAMLETSRFYDIAWISAKQEVFIPHQGLRPTSRPVLAATTFIDTLLAQLDPTLSLACSPKEKFALLTHWLKAQPYLVIIDNLETVNDYQALISTLYHLARPTKFLLTSREYVEKVYSHRLDELSNTATIDFLRYMGGRQSLPALAQASEAQLNEIYAVAGGNPLALKLIIGRLHSGVSLPQLLDKLEQAQGQTIEQLYTFIYWQAWRDLDETTRRLFVLMPQVPNATAEDLARKSKLANEELETAIHQLISRSLIEVRGDLDTPYYRLHRLTETFLLNEVIQWKSLL